MIDELERVYNDVWTAFVGNHLDAHRAALAAVAEHVRKGAAVPAPKAELTEEQVLEIYRAVTGCSWDGWSEVLRGDITNLVNAALARHSVSFVRELSDVEIERINNETYRPGMADHPIRFARACIKAAVTLPEGAMVQVIKTSGHAGEYHQAHFDTVRPGSIYTVFIPDPKPKAQPETINILGHEFSTSDLREALADKQLRETLLAALGEVENGK